MPRSHALCARSGRAASAARLPPSDLPLVLLLEDIGGMQVEGGGGAAIRAAELGVAALADRHVLETTVDDEIDERRRAQDAVGDQVLAEPVEPGADQGADDDH